jgi:hypothetical protein
MIAGDGKVFGFTATAKVEPVNGEAAIQSFVRHAAGVAGKTGALQSVNNNNFAEDLALRLRDLSMDQDLDLGLRAIEDGLDWPALLNFGPPPVVPGHGGEVGVAEERMERGQTKIVRNMRDGRCRIEAGC